jgi:hypothetical protein
MTQHLVPVEFSLGAKNVASAESVNNTPSFESPREAYSRHLRHLSFFAFPDGPGHRSLPSEQAPTVQKKFGLKVGKGRKRFAVCGGFCLRRTKKGKFAVLEIIFTVLLGSKETIQGLPHELIGSLPPFSDTFSFSNGTLREAKATPTSFKNSSFLVPFATHKQIQIASTFMGAFCFHFH